MSFRLAIAVVGATGAGLCGIAAKSGALQDFGVDKAWFEPSKAQSLMTGFGGGTSRLPASVTGSKGAKFVPVPTRESEEPANTRRDAYKSQRDMALQAAGIHTGPDPRVGHSLDALKMRQKDERGQLGIEDIGMDAMIKDIEDKIRTDDF